MGGGEIRSCMDLWNAAAGKGIRGWCPAGEAGEKTEKAKGGLAAALRQGPLHLLWDATEEDTAGDMRPGRAGPWKTWWITVMMHKNRCKKLEVFRQKRLAFLSGGEYDKYNK